MRSKEAEINLQKQFLYKGKYQNGVSSTTSFYPLPEWVQPELIRKGQQFVQRNFFAIYFAHFLSLLFLLCYAPVRVMILKTGKSDTDHKSLKRYLSTLLHVKNWYEGDLLNEKDSAAEDIFRIRKLHAGFLSASQKIKSQLTHTNSGTGEMLLLSILRKDLGNSPDSNSNLDSGFTSQQNENENGPRPIISQLDMAVTQFCFMGFVSIFPKILGFYTDEENLNGFVHLWALIGHLIGIQDEFNICLETNSYARELILHRVLVNHLQNCDTNTLDLWTHLIGGISQSVPFLSLNALLLFSVNNFLGRDGGGLQSTLKKYDKFCLRIMYFCFNHLLVWNVSRLVLNWLLQLCIFLTTLRLFGTSRFRKNSNIRVV